MRLMMAAFPAEWVKILSVSGIPDLGLCRYVAIGNECGRP